MTVVLENYAVPEQGPVEIKVNLSFEIKVTAHQAQRKVDRWLLEYVSVQMGADPPTLVVVDGRAFWRVPAHISYPQVGHAGVVGTVDVDVETGEMLNNTPERIEEFYKCAEKIHARLPPFRIKELPPEYRAKNVPRSPMLVVGEDGFLVVVNDAEQPKPATE